jgi:MinD superfamily P-loop ATPase
MKRPIEVTIVSGKGGTGKTVLVSSLARVFENKVMADCDVDAPDLHLLLKPEIKREESFTGGRSGSCRIRPTGRLYTHVWTRRKRIRANL